MIVERLVGPVRVVGQQRLAGLGVQGDDADVVGGDVVELAGEADALLGRGPLGGGDAVALEVGGPGRHRLAVRPLDAHVVADEPGRRHREQGHDPVEEVVVGIDEQRRDDRRQGDHGDRTPPSASWPWRSPCRRR